MKDVRMQDSRRIGPPDPTLLAAARAAAENAYAPYSGWHVGAAAVFAEAPTEVSRGANVENGSYGLTICAERTALVTAVTAGHRQLCRIALTCRDHTGVLVAKIAPCGACLQMIAEFGTADTEILIDGRGSFRLRDFLPLPFNADTLRHDEREASDAPGDGRTCLSDEEVGSAAGEDPMQRRSG